MFGVMHATTWKNVKDLVLSEISQLKKKILYNWNSVRYLEESNSKRKSRMVVSRG